MFRLDKDTPITLGLVHEYIKKHKAKLPRYRNLMNMYKGKHQILFEEKKADHKPDNRLVLNFAKYIVDTLNGYFLGIPIRIDHDNEEVNQKIDQLNRFNNQDDNNAELSKLSSIYGHAFELIYLDENAKACTTFLSPEECFIVYDDTVKEKPLFACRYLIKNNKSIGTVYTKDLVIEFVDDKVTSEKVNMFDDVPIVEYLENEERLGVFESVIPIINAINKVASEKANDVDYFSDTYLLITGAEVDEEIAKNIRDTRIINLRSPDVKVDVKFLDKPNADNTQENLLNRLERLVYQISMVANINDENFGNASGVSLKYKLQSMDNLAEIKERKFVRSMNDRYKLIFSLPTHNSSDWEGISYHFIRNIPSNLLEEVQVVQGLNGNVSQETALKVLSVVDNPKAEIERMANEDLKNAKFSKDLEFASRFTDADYE